MGGVGVWGLGVRVRMKGVFIDDKPTFSAQQSVGRNSQKNTEKLGATPNQRIKKREVGLSSRQTPFILTLTPKTPYPHTHNFQYKTPSILTLTPKPSTQTPINPGFLWINYNI